jgi:sugar phosphate isomerase/epimerase
MKLGLSSWAYTWAVGVPGREPQNPLRACDLVCRAHDVGLSLVQIADNLSLERVSGAELADIAALAASLDVEVEVGFRGLTRERLNCAIHVARVLHSSLIRFILHGPDCDTTPQVAVALLRSVEPQLREIGAVVAVENYERYASTDFAYVAAEVGPDLVGVCLDTVNQFGRGESLEAVAATLAPHTVNLHIKDYAIRRLWHNLGFTVEGAPAGEGMLAVAPLVGSLESFGRCRTAVLELWTPWRDSLDATIALEQEWVATSLANLRATGLFK